MISILMQADRAFSRSRIIPGLLLGMLGGGAGAADIQKGGELYSAHCAVCHGKSGMPVMPGAPNFRRMDTLMRPDLQLMASIRSGKGAMPAYFGVLREREILDVIAYVRTLS
jgi:cytochrome c6